MNDEIRKTMFKILSLVSLLFGFYPIVKIFKVSLFGKSPVLLEIIFYVALILIVHFSVRLIMIKVNANWNVHMAHGTIFFPVTAVAIYYYNQGLSRMVFEMFITAAFGFFIVRAYFKEYNKLLDGVKISLAVTAILAAFFISTFIEDFMYLQRYFFIVVYAYLFLILILKNQSKMDNVFVERFDKTSGIPAKMREYNTYSIVVVFTFLIVLFNVKNVVILLLKLFGIALMFVIRLILKVISYLIADVNEIDLENRLDNSIVGGHNSNVVAVIANIIIIVLVMAVAYKLIPKIVESLINVVKFLIRRIFNVHEEKTDEFSHYTDTVERVIPPSITVKEQKHRKKPNLKLALKLAEQIKNPQEKIKYLYGVILMVMNLKGIKIEKYDTTGEICKKVVETKEFGQQFKIITYIYEKVKYGEKSPKEEEVLETTEMIQKLSKAE